MLNSMSIKNRIIALSILPVIALVFTLTLVLSELKHTAEGVDRIYLDRVVPLADLKVIADDYAVLVIDAVNKANAGLVTVEQTIETIESSEAEIAQMWQKFMATHHTPEEDRLAKEAEVLFAKADTVIDQALVLLRGMSGNVAGQLDSIDGPLYKDIDPISEKITELINLQLSVAKAEHDVIISEYERDSVLLVVMAAVIIVILLGFCVLVYRSIIGALHRICRTVERIVADSDLSIEIEVRNNNELSAIARSFNTMISQMRGLISHVTETSHKLSHSASEMTSVSADAKKSINTQREEIEQVAAAMNEMVSTAQEISRNAEVADKGARDTSVQAAEGNMIVNQAVDATNVLVTDVESVSQRIKTLESDSDSIGSIVDVIKSIAEQTNLLALNAAIEAARAGDQGRGFAVVADEVRTLAQRTQVSTQEIQEAIERLQSGTSSAVTAMQAGQAKAQGAGSKATEAGEALQTIASAVQGITDMNALIATASEEQTSVSEEINKSLVTLHDTSNNSSAGAEQISRASEELFVLSNELEKTISKYKV
ncbi:MAG: methyl-accepting chemotaxis protein [Pseudomonadales bacterium]